MNPQVFALSEDLTVGEAITALQSSRDVEMVFYLYVVDERRHLVGVTSLRRLLLVSPETPLKRIMTPEVSSVRVDTDQEEVARMVASYNLLAVPVVDEESKLVGIVTVDDVIDVIKDEAAEDLLRLAGVSGDERIETTATEALRKRLPWLGINLVTAFLAASVVAMFESTIQQVTALAIFMPIVAGMGGNAATQTLTVIVRGLALGRVVVVDRAQGAREGIRHRAGQWRHARHRGRRRRLAHERRSDARPRARHGDARQPVCGGHGGNAGAAGIEGAQGRSRAGLVGVHHHVHRRGGVCVVPGASPRCSSGT